MAIVAKASRKELKYTDKSAGQPGLVIIFEAIKSMIKPYAKGTIKERGDKPGVYNLVSVMQIETAGRKFDEIYFVTIMIQKGYVGFYYMPVYAAPEVKGQMKPELLKRLKGKACFHITKNDPAIMEQISDALKAGYNCYVKRGWAK